MDTGGFFYLRRHLIRGALGSLALKIVTTGTTLLLVVVLARILGVEEFGIYAFSLSVVQILTVPAMMGGEIFLVREVAAYRTRCEFERMRGVLLYSRRINFAVSTAFVLASAAIVFWNGETGALNISLLIALPLIFLLSAMQLQGAAMRGLRHILLGQTAQVLRPLLVIVAVLTIFWIADYNLKPVDAIAAQVVCTGFLVLVMHGILQRLLPQKARQVRPVYESSRWIRSMLPLVFASSMQILNKEVSVVMLGLMQNPADVAFFRIAQRGVMLIPLVLVAVNMAIGPTVSELFVRGEKQRLQRLIRRSIAVVTVFAVPLALFLIFGGKWLISLIFGAEFEPAYILLVILCAGQLVNACMGSVGLILNMSGLERITARGVAIAAIVNIFLNLSLIPFFGAVGAAIASSFSLVVWNVLLAVWLYRQTGLVTTILPIPARKDF